MTIAYSRALTATERALARDAAIAVLLEGALHDLGLNGSSVACRMTTAREVHRLNLRFAGVDAPTDVLAFPVVDLGDGVGFRLPSGETPPLGDIVIAVSIAVRQAAEYQVDPVYELSLLAVHGLLHLLGHDHHEGGEAEQMTTATRQLLARAAARRGLPPPQVPSLRPFT